MSHKPIQFKNVSLTFAQKLCFEDFQATVLPASRIAIIGSNGSGKSSLLKIIQRKIEPTSGEVLIPSDVQIGYVPQIVEDFESLSGAERLNKALSAALSLKPNVLLLDEPTNHLDQGNRRSLIRMLQDFPGTIIVASHDEELLSSLIDTIWHIEEKRVRLFSGSFEDYKRKIIIRRTCIEEELLPSPTLTTRSSNSWLIILGNIITYAGGFFLASKGHFNLQLFLTALIETIA